MWHIWLVVLGLSTEQLRILDVEDVETKSTLFETVPNVLVQYFWMLLPARGRSVNGAGKWSNFRISHCS